MNMSDTGQITQKDLLKLLVDQAQHNATRDELNRVEDKLTTRIDAVETKLSARIEAVETKIDEKFSSLKLTIIVTVTSSTIALTGVLIALAQLIKA